MAGRGGHSRQDTIAELEHGEGTGHGQHDQEEDAAQKSSCTHGAPLKDAALQRQLA